jgi:uncharacterized protein (DUF1330 family)
MWALQSSWEEVMRAKYNVALALAAGFVVGAGAIQALHAQAKPSYVLAMINVKDEDGYKNNFLKEAQKQIADHGGKYVAGGFNKTTALTGSPPNRVVLIRFDSLDKVKAWQDGGARDLQEKTGAKYADFQYVLAVEAVEGM